MGFGVHLNKPGLFVWVYGYMVKWILNFCANYLRKIGLIYIGTDSITLRLIL